VVVLRGEGRELAAVLLEEAPPFVRVPRDGSLFLVFMGRDLVACERDGPIFLLVSSSSSSCSSRVGDGGAKEGGGIALSEVPS